MKISKEQAAENRQKVVEAATRLFKARGVDQVSVAEVMAEAGFTHGGFYNHFDDKEALETEVCRSEFERSVAQLKDSGDLEGYLRSYLSPTHRDHPATGCPMSALVGDAARHAELQQAYADGLEATIDAFAEAIQRSGVSDPKHARNRALRLVNELVGALTLARAVQTARPRLSNELLHARRDSNPRPSA